MIEQGVGEAFFVCPLRIAEDGIECTLISLLNFAHSMLQSLADIACLLADILPVAFIGDLEAVVFWKERVLSISARFLQRGCHLFVVHIRDTFKEKQWEDIRLEISGINGTA